MDYNNSLRRDLFADITHTLDSDSSLDVGIDSDEDISDTLTAFRSPSRLGFSVSNYLEDNKTEERQKWTYAFFQNVSSEESLFSEPGELDVSHLDGLGFGHTSPQPTKDLDSAHEVNSDTDINSTSNTITPCLPSSPNSFSRKPTRPPSAPPLVLPLTSPCLTDHGLSKSALNHLRWFWALRHDEWLAWEAQVAEIQHAHALSLSANENGFGDDEPYGGIAILPSSLPKLILPPSPSSPSYRLQNTSLSLPASEKIYPRQGDISALRDPYCVDVDMCFREVPLWTMGKVLWGFDAEHRVAALSHQQKQESAKDAVGQEVDDLTESDDFEDITLGSEYSDSELTLVSESLPPTPTSAVRKAPYSPLESSSQYSRDSEEDDEYYTWDGVRAWEISWYARWEVLVELVRRDEIPFSIPAPVSGPGEVQKKEKPTFFFADEEDEDGQYREEDEDYGIILPNPIYGLKTGSRTGIGTVYEGMTQGIDVKSGEKVLCD